MNTKYFKLRLGNLHGESEMDQLNISLQRVSLYFSVGGDLVDLISLADQSYQICYQVPKEVENDLSAQLIVQTPNKVRQVVFGRIEGNLSSLLAMSNNMVAKLWIDLDLQAEPMSPSLRKNQGTKFSNATSSSSQHKLCVLIYTGSKDSTELESEVNFSPRKEKSKFRSDLKLKVEEQLMAEEFGQIENMHDKDVRSLMPPHMPQYLRIDKDIREGLFQLSAVSKMYANFDVLAYEREVQRTLELELDRQSADFKNHNRRTTRKLSEAIQKLEDCLLLKDDTVRVRAEEIHQIQQNFKACQDFVKVESIDSVQLQEQRSLLLKLDSQLRRAYNINALSQIEASKLSTIEKLEKDLVDERREVVLTIVRLALLDVTHHLTLIQNKNKLSEVDLNNLKEFLSRILAQSKEAKLRYAEMEERLKKNMQENQSKTETLRLSLTEIVQQNKQLMLTKEKQDKNLLKLKADLDTMLVLEQQISTDWINGVALMEAKLLEMKDMLGTTFEQLQENNRMIAQYKVRLQTLKIRIAIENKVKDSFNAAKFKERYEQLEEAVKATEKGQKVLKEKISSVQQGWVEYYALALDEIKTRFTLIDKQTLMNYLNKSKDDHEKLENEITQITDEIRKVQGEIELKTNRGGQGDEDGDVEDLESLKIEAEEKLIKFKTLLNKKSVLYAELVTSARILMDLNDQLIQNEEAKLRLSEEIDVRTLEIFEKKQNAVTLQENLSALKDEYKILKNDISSLDSKAEFLKQRIKECEDEYDMTAEQVMLKKLEIEQLEKTAGVKAPNFELKVQKQSSQTAYYRPVKGDFIDELVGKYLTEMECTLPVKRLQDGFYLFGTLKIYMKAHQGKLIVRQKAGQMQFQDFVDMNLHEQKELVENMKKTNEWDQDALADFYLKEINQQPSISGHNVRASMASPGRKHGLTSPGRNQFSPGTKPSPGRGSSSNNINSRR